MRAVAIVPCFQNAQTVPGVLAALEQEGFETIAVDDGSTDGTQEFLKEWLTGNSRRHAVLRERNGGKAAALHSGFAEAKRLGCDIAVTVDADGQHLASDAARVRDACIAGRAGDATGASGATGATGASRTGTARALITGCRDETSRDYPRSSLFGRRLWALGTRALTGIGVGDPVCGLRAYPLHMVDAVRCHHGLYAWEEEFLVRAVWQGCEVRAVPITTVYLPRETRVSHYSLPRDWGHGALLYLGLTGERLLPWQRIAPAAQPLARRDRSWRRLLGAVTFVGATGGALLPLWISLPVVGYFGWRMHAPLLVVLPAIAAGWWLAGATNVWVAIAAAVAVAPVITLALRPLDRS